jgi:transposase
VRDQRTRAYVARRIAEGKTTPEIIRCLKRFIARELYQLLSTAASTNHRAAVA